MSELQLIESALERAAGRRRRERAFRGLWRGTLVGASIWLAAVVVYKLAPIPLWILNAAAAAGFAAVLAGGIIGGWRRNSLAETARWVDGRQKLQERLSTALELAKGQGAESWRQLLVADAATHVKDLDPRRLVQFRLPAASRWAVLVLALAAGLAFIPEYRSKNFVQKQADQKVIKETGRQLTELTKRSLQTRPPALETTQKAMEAVNELGDQLAHQKLSRSDALKDLAKVTDRLKDQVSEMGRDPAIQRMQQAARSRSSETSPEAARLQKQLEAAQKQMGDPKGTPEDMDKLDKKLSKIEEAAKAAADKNGGMSQADKENLSKSLSALSKEAQQMGMQMPNLDAAVEALAANQTDMVLKDLDVASNDLEKTRDLAKSIEQMQQQMEKIGKDLGEQLKNGQPEAAQASLQKMMDQLKSGNLSKEQLQKMLSECTNAIDPGSHYGKVGELLKAAAAKMGDGQKPDAAKSLAEASKELEKLMQQMNDAKELQAELAALNKASTCIGTCQGWGACKNPGYSKKNSGKPGSGYGNWENEEDGWGYDGQQTARWDNTGQTRPDMDAKGTTDRGDAVLNDALRPDKVKGQFTPGGSMPSITLKGVSIRGQSKVAFTEAAVAAQADAQSALSQEKVPRAYQGAVRNYFDDAKNDSPK